MTRSEFVIQALLSLNVSNYNTSIKLRPHSAVVQYDELVALGVNFDEEHEKEIEEHEKEIEEHKKEIKDNPYQ